MKTSKNYGFRKAFKNVENRRVLRVAALGSAVIAFLAAGQANAQIVTYTTSGLTGATASVSPTNGTGATGTSLVRGGSPTTTANSSSATFASTNNLYTANTPDFTQKYEGYTVAPTSTTGSVLFAKTITLSVSGSNTASNSYAVAYSTDGFVTNLASTGTVTTMDTLKTFDITDLITNDTLAVRIQDYGTTAANATSTVGSGGSFKLGSSTNAASVVTGSVLTTASDAVTLTANTEVRTATAITLGGVISGGFNLTKNESGTLTLTNNNTFSGTTTINAGTISAAGTGANQALGATTQVTVNRGGTLSLGADNQIKSTAPLTLGTATGTGTANFSTGNHAQTLGALTLNSSASITLGGGASTLNFADSSASTFAAGATLSILNYSGTVYSQDGTTTLGTAGDVLNFGTTASGLTTSELAQIQFVDPAGYTGTFPAFINSTGEVFAQVPEPATILGGLLLVGAAGLSQRRRLSGLAGSVRTRRTA